MSYTLAKPSTFLLCWVHSSFESQFNSAAVNAAETAQCCPAICELDADLALEADVPLQGQCCVQGWAAVAGAMWLLQAAQQPLLPARAASPSRSLSVLHAWHRARSGSLAVTDASKQSLQQWAHPARVQEHCKMCKKHVPHLSVFTALTA